VKRRRAAKPAEQIAKRESRRRLTEVRAEQRQWAMQQIETLWRQAGRRAQGSRSTSRTVSQKASYLSKFGPTKFRKSTSIVPARGHRKEKKRESRGRAGKWPIL